jgi:hypothetical protein
MHRRGPMRESFNHRPAGWVRKSRKRCIQSIHNRMVVDCPRMSSVDFEAPGFASGSSLKACQNPPHANVDSHCRIVCSLGPRTSFRNRGTATKIHGFCCYGGVQRETRGAQDHEGFPLVPNRDSSWRRIQCRIRWTLHCSTLGVRNRLQWVRNRGFHQRQDLRRVRSSRTPI